MKTVFFYYIFDFFVTFIKYYVLHIRQLYTCWISFALPFIFFFINFSSWQVKFYFAGFSQGLLLYPFVVSRVCATDSASKDFFLKSGLILFFIVAKWLYFFFHSSLSLSPVWSSTFWFFTSLFYALFQRRSLSFIVHVSWALLPDMFQHVPTLSWRNCCLDMYSLFFLIVVFLMPFFLVSAGTKAFAEGNAWRKWDSGNWVGKRLRPWMSNKRPPLCQGGSQKQGQKVGIPSVHTPLFPLLPGLGQCLPLWTSDTTFSLLLVCSALRI